MAKMTPEGSNITRNELHFFILTPEGSHLFAEQIRRGTTPSGLGLFFVVLFAINIEPLQGSVLLKQGCRFLSTALK